MLDRGTGTPPMQVLFPGEARDFFFSPSVTFQCRLSYGVRTPPCAIACINICARVKDPVVPVRVRWIMETLKHTACTVGWVARLCYSWLSPGKATRICHEKNPIGTIQLFKKKKKANLSVKPDRQTTMAVCALASRFCPCSRNPTSDDRQVTQK